MMLMILKFFFQSFNSPELFGIGVGFLNREGTTEAHREGIRFKWVNFWLWNLQHEWKKIQINVLSGFIFD